MIRLHVTSEGQTEQNFVRSILSMHLGGFGIIADARCVLTSKDKRSNRIYRGGMTTFTKAKRDIEDWIREDSNADCRFTTMFDLYALPSDFPGYQPSLSITDPYRRVQFLEDALRKDIGCDRFIPYIQLHEFEALILSDPAKLEYKYLDNGEAIRKLARSISGYDNPELIDSGYETAPSKRIIYYIPEYDKNNAGVSVVKAIGMHTLKVKCPHFGDWVAKLESLK